MWQFNAGGDQPERRNEEHGGTVVKRKFTKKQHLKDLGGKIGFMALAANIQHIRLTRCLIYLISNYIVFNEIVSYAVPWLVEKYVGRHIFRLNNHWQIDLKVNFGS